MTYWEIIADNLSKAGWSWGYCSAVTPHGWRWIRWRTSRGRSPLHRPFWRIA